MVEPIKHTRGVYSYNSGMEISSLSRKSKLIKNDVSGILKKVDTMQLDDKDDEEEDTVDENLEVESITQGDRLNQSKLQRRLRMNLRQCSNL